MAAVCSKPPKVPSRGLRFLGSQGYVDDSWLSSGEGAAGDEQLLFLSSLPIIRSEMFSAERGQFCGVGHVLRGLPSWRDGRGKIWGESAKKSDGMLDLREGGRYRPVLDWRNRRGSVSSADGGRSASVSSRGWPRSAGGDASRSRHRGMTVVRDRGPQITRQRGRRPW